MRTLKVAISTCPNDTFMFEALYNRRIDMGDIAIDWYFGDIEELNQNAAQGIADITKISFNALFSLTDTYLLLNSGTALGFNCGPQLIAKESIDISDLSERKVAIPGLHTTANLLLSAFFPNIKNKVESLFSDIEQAIISHQVDAGLIIHESRFTYQNKGLVKLIDLGEYWEQQYKLPLPLGAIAGKKNLDPLLRKEFDLLLQKSIQYAFDHRQTPMPFIREKAQELDDNVINQHIQLYVNEYSLNIGKEGRKAIDTLYNHAKRLGLTNMNELEFNDSN